MLYTRTGDTGTTRLFGCDGRISKTAPRIEALGNLDELNSWIGLCAANMAKDDAIARYLRAFQEDLFVLQAHVAGASKAIAADRVRFLEEVVASVEREIEPLRSFTIPGAVASSGMLDVARTVARRTERSVIAIQDESLATVIPYLNRLSSALFALARIAAHRAHVKEQSPRY